MKNFCQLPGMLTGIGIGVSQKIKKKKHKNCGDDQTQNVLDGL